MQDKIGRLVFLIFITMFLFSSFLIPGMNSYRPEEVKHIDSRSFSDDGSLELMIGSKEKFYNEFKSEREEVKESLKATLELTSHPIIKIDSDEDFISTARAEGWKGDGSKEDPFVIENYSIDARGAGNAIMLSNTTLYFRIINCFVYNATWVSNPYLAGEGIALYNTSNGKIIGNTAFSNDGDGIDLEITSNVLVKDNRAYSNSDDGIHLTGSSDNIVLNNTISTNDDDGIFLQGNCKNNIISNNTINLNSRYSIVLSYSDSNRIENNEIIKSRAGIVCSNCKKSKVLHNEVQNAEYGIYLINTNTSHIRDNSGSGGDYGLYISTSSLNLISNNTFMSSELYGITISLSSNRNMVDNNTVTAHKKYGLYISASRRNFISNNTIFSNKWDGISLFKANNNVFTYNNITENYAGMGLTDSKDNLIFNNNFINNNQPVYTDKKNLWNEDYPIGGNYWSDYKGEDLYRGPDQDEEGGDGIGDTRYVVFQQNNIDHYPLMNPIRSASQISAPSEPQNFRVKAAEGFVRLDWDIPIDTGGSPITDYRVYKGTDTDNISFLTSTTELKTSYQDDDVENNRTYFYYVTAVNKVGEGNRTITISATPRFETIEPPSPQNLTADFDEDTITLRWDPGLDNISVSQYNIYRGRNSSDKVLIDNVSGFEYMYRDKDIEYNVTYFYHVKGENSVGEGNRSKEVSVKVPSKFSPPGPPRNIVIEEGDNNITLYWDPPDDTGGKKVVGYKIYRSKGDGEKVLFATVQDELVFRDKNTTNYQTYKYRISSYNSVGESQLSEDVSGTPVFQGDIGGDTGKYLEYNWFIFPLTVILSMLLIAKIFVIRPIFKA